MLIVTKSESVTRTNANNETKTYQRNTIVEATKKKDGTFVPKYPVRVAKTEEGYLRPAVAQIPGFGFYEGMVIDGEMEFDAEKSRWDVLVVEEEVSENVLENVAE